MNARQGFIALPDQTLALVLGRAGGPIAEALGRLLDCTVTTWDINRPEAQAETLADALAVDLSAVVHLPSYHDKALPDFQRLARRKGLACAAIVPDDHPAPASFDFAARYGDQFERRPMPFDLRDDAGPFDIIGDIHGCARELMQLLETLGHAKPVWSEAPAAEWHEAVIEHPSGRRVILLGDLTDRGPLNLASIRIAQRLVALGGLVTLGNHDEKLRRWLAGGDVTVSSSMQVTIEELGSLDETERNDLASWLAGHERHYLLDGGALVVAHAGLPERLHGRDSREARSVAIYGLVDEEAQTDDDGYPNRIDWAQDYTGRAHVVHGHVVRAAARSVNQVHSIDTGCVFGGHLTALRWPELTIEAVPAARTYCEGKIPA